MARPKVVSVGIVGCGTIGSVLARTIRRELGGVARLGGLCDRIPGRAARLRKQLKSTCPELSLAALVKHCDFIIESASSEAITDILPQAIRYGKSVLVMSVGGLLGVRNLASLLARSGSRLYVPSGAIGAIDAVLAAQEGNITSVTLTSQKPAKNLASSPYLRRRAKSLRFRKPVVVFEGSASAAARWFPESMNVAASLALAGAGAQRTKVRIVASPRLKRNIHRIKLLGSFGRACFETENVPSPGNPKTSTLAIQSAVACLKKIFSPLKIGT
jgi:aspartate dehydrogenase